VIMTDAELKGALEAMIYAADEPATVEQLAGALGIEKPTVRAALDQLVAAYACDDRGVEIRAVAGGYKMYTKAQHHEVVRQFIKGLRPPLRLTMPALETLAVIAYKQPATLPEIQEIRGVNCSWAQACDRPADSLPHLERFSDALRALRCGRVAEPERV